MRIRGCMVSRPGEVLGVAAVISVNPSLPLQHTGAGSVPVVPGSNSFNVNGLQEIEEERCASFWPLAGTLVPVSDMQRGLSPALKKNARLCGGFPSPDLQLPVLVLISCPKP